MAIGFLRNTGMDPLEKQLDPWVQSLFEEGLYSTLMKYADDKEKNLVRTPLMEFSRMALEAEHIVFVLK